MIRAKEVCGMGKWKGGKWQGPPRATLAPRFHKWCNCLAAGTDIGEAGTKETAKIQVQSDHFQNTYIFAERPYKTGGNKPRLSSSFDNMATQPPSISGKGRRQE